MTDVEWKGSVERNIRKVLIYGKPRFRVQLQRGSSHGRRSRLCKTLDEARALKADWLANGLPPREPGRSMTPETESEWKGRVERGISKVLIKGKPRYRIQLGPRGRGGRRSKVCQTLEDARALKADWVTNGLPPRTPEGPEPTQTSGYEIHLTISTEVPVTLDIRITPRSLTPRSDAEVPSE